MLVVGGIVVVARAGVVLVVVDADGFWFATALNQAAACAGEPSFLLFAHASPGSTTVSSSTPTTRRTRPKLARPADALHARCDRPGGRWAPTSLPTRPSDFGGDSGDLRTGARTGEILGIVAGAGRPGCGRRMSRAADPDELSVQREGHPHKRRTP